MMIALVSPIAPGYQPVSSFPIPPISLIISLIISGFVTSQLNSLAITVVGVAEVMTSVVAPMKVAKTMALPTAAGLKILFPKPPNNSFAKKIAKKVETPSA